MFFRKSKIVICITLLLILAATLSFVPRQALAASSGQGFNLTTSPLPVDLTASPGSTISTPLRVQNSGTKSVRLKVQLMRFNAYGEEGKPAIVSGRPQDTFLKWASFSQTSFMADPGVWNTITMTLKIPKSAAFGYYYAVLFTPEGQGAEQPGANLNTITGAVAVLVLLDVHAPGERRQLTVEQFTASRHVYEYLPASFSIKVHNSGNVHVAPTGNIFIGRGRNTNLGILHINDAGGNVLPNSNRVFQVAWTDGFPAFQIKRDADGQIVSDSRGRPIEQLKWDWAQLAKFRFGHYHAHMVLIYDDGTRDIPIEGDVSFWVIPWKLLLGLVVFLGLVCVGLWTIGRGTYRRVRTKVHKR